MTDDAHPSTEPTDEDAPTTSGNPFGLPRPDAFVRLADVTFPRELLQTRDEPRLRDVIDAALVTDAQGRVGFDPAADAAGFEVNTIAWRMEVPYALYRDYTTHPETPIEATIRVARAQESANRAARAWRAHDAALEAFATVTDPALRGVLVLHRPQEAMHGLVCRGCDMAGMEAEPPDWPCTTVETVATALGVDVPNAWHLTSRRPPDHSWRPANDPLIGCLSCPARFEDHPTEGVPA